MSLANATLVAAALEHRRQLTQQRCICEPYADVFTFHRWKAQGRDVRRGEHAVAKIPVWVETDEEPDEERPGKIMQTSAVFCRCQTKEHQPADLSFKTTKRTSDGRMPDRRDCDNGCGCLSYVDIFTAGRWRAQGYHVRAGEHANFHGGKRFTIPLFCRCQVDPNDGTAVEWENGTENPIDIDSIPGFETVTNPEPASAPVPALVDTTHSAPIWPPHVVADGPAQIVNGVPVMRLQLVRDSAIAAEQVAVSEPAGAVDIFRAYLGTPDREHVVALMLDTKHHPVGIHTVSIGTLNQSVVSAREVFKAAVLANAAAIVLCHNHPSGDPTPSAEDVAITKKLREAGVLLDIELLDHIVLGNPDWVSLRERGLGF
jgi:DNA repair protein RadC